MWASSSFFGSLQFRDSLLGDLQLAFNLPSLLLNVTSASLLLVQRALEFIQGLLKLLLDLVQVVNFVVSNLQIFRSLGAILRNMLLLLVQLVNDFILVGNLIIERPDCVVPVGLLLFQLLDGNVQIFNVLLNSSALLFKSLLVSLSWESCSWISRSAFWAEVLACLSWY